MYQGSHQETISCQSFFPTEIVVKCAYIHFFSSMQLIDVLQAFEFLQFEGVQVSLPTWLIAKLFYVNCHTMVLTRQLLSGFSHT